MACRTARERKRRPESIVENREAPDFPDAGFDRLVGGMVSGGAPPGDEDDEESLEPRPGPRWGGQR